MEQLCKEYVKLLTSEGNASDHFWKLEGRIKNDKKNPGVMLELRKSDAIFEIVRMIKLKVIMEKDLLPFNDDLREASECNGIGMETDSEWQYMEICEKIEEYCGK